MTEVNFEIFLGLSNQELRLYRALAVEPLTVAEIARRARLPRMTVHYILQRLLKRSLVDRIKRDKKLLYFIVPREHVLIRLLPHSLMPEGSVPVPITPEVGITVYRGLGGIYEMYEKVCRENKNKRVYAIQTTASTRQIYQNYSLESLDILHAEMIKNKLIMVDIVEEDFFEPIKEKYGNGFEQSIELFLNRLLVTHVLPKGLLSFTSDMIIFKTVVAFIDWEQQVAIEIRNQQRVRMCFDFFELLLRQTKRMEFRKLAKRYL